MSFSTENESLGTITLIVTCAAVAIMSIVLAFIFGFENHKLKTCIIDNKCVVEYQMNETKKAEETTKAKENHHSPTMIFIPKVNGGVMPIVMP
jgi:hypothetical protein